MVTNSKIGRNAGTGKFTSVEKARSAPKTHVVETVKRNPPPATPPKKK